MAHRRRTVEEIRAEARRLGALVRVQEQTGAALTDARQRAYAEAKRAARCAQEAADAAVAAEHSSVAAIVRRRMSGT